MGKIRVSNLSRVTTEEELGDYFGFCGEIERIQLFEDGECKGAHIWFRSPAAAEAALFLSGTLIHGKNIMIKREKSSNNNSEDEEEGNDEDNEESGIDIYCDETDENIKERDHGEANRKAPFEALLEDVIATGQSLSRTMVEKLLELDELYGISEYIRALSVTVQEKYESTGAARAVRAAGGTIRDSAVQTWAEAMRLLGGGEPSAARTNYNTFRQN